MARNFGSLSIVDTLRTIDATNINDYGIDNLYANMRLLLDAHNTMTNEILDTFGYKSKDKIDRYGGTIGPGGFQQLSETGVPAPQKTSISGVDVGFPLYRFGRATQWTHLYWKQKTPADFIKEMVQLMIDDVTNIEQQLKRTLFNSVNNLTYIDRFDNLQQLPVRALLNADSAPIPPDKYGNTFNPATHTHYLATASVTASNVDALVTTVVEHGMSEGEQIFIYINRADEAAFTALSGFKYYEYDQIQRGGGYTGDIQLGGSRPTTELDNVAIGRWDSYVEVWLKPWIPAGYYLCFASGGIDQLIRWRTPFWGDGDLELMYEHEHHPFTAQAWERYMGLGIWIRHKAAILYTGGGTYVVPTFPYPIS